MKTNLMKKAVAVTLSVAMACSASMIASPTTASAAAKVGVKTTFKTLQIGSKHTLRIVNGSGWKITKAKSTDKTIANGYFISKSKGYVKVKGKSEGKAAIKVTLKNTKTKKTATAKCLYKVVAPTTIPDVPDNPNMPDTPSVDTEATVDSQAGLNEALANKDVKKITINGGTEFTIAAGDYKDKKLIINAPQADVTNSGSFESIEIKAIKNETYTENGTDNKIIVSASAPCRIIIGDNGVVEAILFNTSNTGVTLVANGTVKGVTISAKLAIIISGKTTVPVLITKDAVETKLTASTPVTVDTKAANTEVKLEDGAAGSTVKLTDDTASVAAFENKTGQDVTVTKNNGESQVVKTGNDPVKIDATQSTTPGNNTTPGTTTPGTSTSTNKAKNNNTVDPSNLAIVENSTEATTSTITSTGGVTYTSVSAISFKFKGVTTTSNAAYEFLKSVTDGAGNTANDLSWTSASADKDGYVTVTVNDLKASQGEEITLTLKFRAQETATLQAGEISENVVTIKLAVGYDETNKKYTVTATKS